MSHAPDLNSNKLKLILSRFDFPNATGDLELGDTVINPRRAAAAAAVIDRLQHHIDTGHITPALAAGILCVAAAESRYGQGWGPVGRDSFNLGAVTGRGPKGFFIHKDSRPRKDGTIEVYETEFKKYNGFDDATDDLIRIISGRTMRIATRRIPRLSTVALCMYKNGYYTGVTNNGPLAISQYTTFMRNAGLKDIPKKWLDTVDTSPASSEAVKADWYALFGDTDVRRFSKTPLRDEITTESNPGPRPTVMTATPVLQTATQTVVTRPTEREIYLLVPVPDPSVLVAHDWVIERKGNSWGQWMTAKAIIPRALTAPEQGDPVAWMLEHISKETKPQQVPGPPTPLPNVPVVTPASPAPPPAPPPALPPAPPQPTGSQTSQTGSGVTDPAVIAHTIYKWLQMYYTARPRPDAFGWLDDPAALFMLAYFESEMNTAFVFSTGFSKTLGRQALRGGVLGLNELYLPFRRTAQARIGALAKELLPFPYPQWGSWPSSVSIPVLTHWERQLADAFVLFDFFLDALPKLEQGALPSVEPIFATLAAYWESSSVEGQKKQLAYFATNPSVLKRLQDASAKGRALAKQQQIGKYNAKGVTDKANFYPVPENIRIPATGGL